MKETLRYLGAGQNTPEDLWRQAVETAERLTARIQPRYVYRMFDLQTVGAQICIQGTGVVLTGTTAHRMLDQCGKAVLLACTLGASFDALLRTEQARDMSRAVILDACGSALVERGCDQAEREIAARVPDRFLTDRFSPGYGDLPLNLQGPICAALDSARRLGLHVSERFLLNPGKSVTAVIGLSGRPQPARVRGCAYCSMQETCQLRKGGNSCGL